MRVLLSTQNLHKLAELREILPEWQIEPLVADGYPDETGETYYENALIKARFAHGFVDRAAGEWAFGEDSGIECDALDGAPGLHSARWAPGRDQADALLERLAGEANRRIRMITELVAISPSGEEIRGSGVLEGELAPQRRGSGGFGYDPIFVPLGDTRTVAEIGDAWKRQNSHRARAALALAEQIATACADAGADAS